MYFKVCSKYIYSRGTFLIFDKVNEPFWSCVFFFSFHRCSDALSCSLSQIPVYQRCELAVTVFHHVIPSDSQPKHKVWHSVAATQLLTTLWSPGAGTRSDGCSRPGCPSPPRGGGLRRRSPGPAGRSALCLHPAATWRRSERQARDSLGDFVLHWNSSLYLTVKSVNQSEDNLLQLFCVISPPISASLKDCVLRWYPQLLFIDYNSVCFCAGVFDASSLMWA